VGGEAFLWNLTRGHCGANNESKEGWAEKSSLKRAPSRKISIIILSTIPLACTETTWKSEFTSVRMWLNFEEIPKNLIHALP
jgi:hypothetical protein